MINQLFSSAKNLPGCIVFLPAEPEQFAAVNSFLNSHNFAKIPRDYAEFLALSNGFIYNGVELMGTIPQQRIEKRYIFPDIIQINKPYFKYEYFRGKIVLGRVSESFITYDSGSGTYALLDRINLRTRIEVKTFADLFAGILKLCETPGA